MNLASLTLDMWQKLADEYRPLAQSIKHGHCFRIDGTIMSTARFFGGMVLDGHRYQTFCVPGTDGAVIACREDFIKWITEKGRKERKARKTSQEGVLL